MPVRKAPRADLKRQYPLALQFGALLALGLVLVAFLTPYRAASSFEVTGPLFEPALVPDIDPTRHELPPPPLPKPPAPVEVPDTEVIDDTEIDINSVLDVAASPPLPPPPAPTAGPEPPLDEVARFLPIEDQPKLLPSEPEAMADLQQCIRYPEMAKQAQIEGRVFVQFIVDEQGTVTEPRVVRGIGGGADEEALRCVRALRFSPGMQRGRPVKVEFSLPVTFRLR